MTQGVPRALPRFVDASAEALPPPPLVTPTGRTGLEVGQWKQAFPKPQFTAPGTNHSFSPELLVYTTKARRRGVDVYVTTDPAIVFNPTGVLVVRVYARSGNAAQHLVAQGLVGFEIGGTVLGSPASAGRWACAARAAAETFDVTVQYHDSATFPTGGNLIVTTVASDEVVEAPRDVGVVLAQSIVSSGGTIIDLGSFVPGTKVAIAGLELVSVYAANDAGAARYLQAFDRFNGLSSGSIPQMVWPMGAVAGGGAVERDIGHRFTKGLILGVSSTAGTYTSVTDCTIQAEIR